MRRAAIGPAAEAKRRHVSINMTFCQPKMASPVYRWIDRLSGALLPPRCVLCSARGQAPCLDLCPACQEAFPVTGRPSCPGCAGTMEPGARGSFCVQCQARPRAYERCHAAYDYAFPVDHLIRALKYRGRLALSRVLGTLLAESVVSCGLHREVDTILPVPLHPNRLVERGFNPSLEISRWTARQLDLRLAARCVRRRRDTRPQVGLPLEQRKRNLVGAFEVPQRLSGLRIAVVDDVITTGSTASEIALVLRRAGAVSVHVWCVCRAPTIVRRDEEARCLGTETLNSALISGKVKT
jgi:ComF family protein